MSKKMLIEATHPEETRMVVVEGNRLDELDVETSTKKQIKGNIYLAKIVRVEPSLQAAFVEYGGNRHGFLAFNEIRPDYYQIPVADREALKQEMLAAQRAEEEAAAAESDTKENSDNETVSDTDVDDMPSRPRFHSNIRRYRIQEVIHHNQLVLVQVVKEERGNKGAALTTYISLAGRYSVLMPNNASGGGVSRKIVNGEDRRRLKAIVESLPMPDDMSIIIRTAGKDRTKAEIKRDFDYLSKTWNKILEKTQKSFAPALIHEEGNLIKRSLRDAFTDDIDEVLIEGEDAFKSLKDFIKLLMPKQAKKIKEYKGEIPLFQTYDIENQIEQMNSKEVHLKSGGYLVIDQAEALVAIDVNSGRATRERNIEETALNTNLEAAQEIARQLRLRDLAGLVVIDFIDMAEMRNNHAVERCMKDALKSDRARIQMGKITGFGLMELSRQRLRSSLLETGHSKCPMCLGTGFVRSPQSCAMHALHMLEHTAEEHEGALLTLTLPYPVAFYVLNNKRDTIAQTEERHSVKIVIEGDATMVDPTDFRMEHAGGFAPAAKTKAKVKANRFRRLFPFGGSDEVADEQPAAEEKPAKTRGTRAEKIEKAEKTEHTERAENRPEKRERNRSRRRGGRHFGGTEKTAEGFKVVHQEAMVVYDSHAQAVTPADEAKKDVVKHENHPVEQAGAQTTAVTATEEKPVRRRGRPKKAADEQKAEAKTPVKATAKASANPTADKPAAKSDAAKSDAAAEANRSERPASPKKGWWNKLVN